MLGKLSPIEEAPSVSSPRIANPAAGRVRALRFLAVGEHHEQAKGRRKKPGIQRPPRPAHEGATSPKADSTRSQPKSAEQNQQKLQKFRGVLQDFNFSPKGGIEGFLLHSDGQTVQVNVTAEVGFAVVRGIGQNVEATVEPETDDGQDSQRDHPVYRLVALTGTDGKHLIFAGPGEREVVTVQGVVKRINYARNGEANGVVLDSGDFIHLKPEGMKRADLKVGDQVTAEGTAGMMPLGQQVVEAKTVNGVAESRAKRSPRDWRDVDRT